MCQIRSCSTKCTVKIAAINIQICNNNNIPFHSQSLRSTATYTEILLKYAVFVKKIVVVAVPRNAQWLVHKSLLGHMPEYISDLLTSVASIPGRSTLRTSSCGNLIVPRTRRRIGDRAFSVAAPQAWNRLPTELKLLQSTDSFRCDLKTFLFHSVYGNRIQTDSVMCPRSSSSGRNTSASVIVNVTAELPLNIMSTIISRDHKSCCYQQYQSIQPGSTMTSAYVCIRISSHYHITDYSRRSSNRHELWN